MAIQILSLQYIYADTTLETNIKFSEESYKVFLQQYDTFNMVRVISKDSTENVAIYNKVNNRLTINGKGIEIKKKNNVSNVFRKWVEATSNEYYINVVGMTVGGIVAAITALSGFGVAPSVVSSMLSSALADNIIQEYISIRVRNYYDDPTLNQNRPKYYSKTEIYAGKNFERFIVSY